MKHLRASAFAFAGLLALAASAGAQPTPNTSVYEFRTGSPGPCAALVQSNDGKLYGVTTSMPGAVPGGANQGEVFRIDPLGTAGNYTTLQAFPLDGSQGKDFGPLVQAGDGNFYATATNGGAFSHGAILRITPTGQIAVVKSFDPAHADGVNPRGGLTLASDGFLYGTTTEGGGFSYGTVFRIAPSGAFVTLKAFTGSNGARPQSPPVQATDGALYGTAGDKFYRVALDGTFTVVASGLDPTGTGHLSGLTAASDGHLYFTRKFGGSGGGAVVRITTAGVATDLYSFSSSVGEASPQYPDGGVVQGGDGRLYGTTPWLGTGHPGTGHLFAVSLSGSLDRVVPLSSPGGSSVRHITPVADGSYFVATCRDLQRFTPPSTMSVWRRFEEGGYYPSVAPIEGKDGNLYGTTTRGGANDKGTAYRLTRAGALTTLASFDPANGAPWGSPLVEGPDGNFYGVSYNSDPRPSIQTLFRLSRSGTVTTLASLPPGGTIPPFSAALVDGGDGLIYGVTSHGEQDFDCGTAFTLSMSGVITRIGVFPRDACHPNRLVVGADGHFYGRTYEGFDRSFRSITRTFRLTRAGVVTAGVAVPASVDANPITKDGTRYGADSEGTLGGGRIYREPPEFAADRTSLRFGATSNGAGFVQQTSDQIIRLTQIGVGSIAWSVTANQPWLRVSPATGTGSGSISVGVQLAAGVPVSGTLSGSLTITTTGAKAAVPAVPVTLAVTPIGSSTAPFGVWDSPVDNSTVTGSLPLTGWALDDLEVVRVRLLRDPVGSEAPGTQVPVGTAVLVDGARPDVLAVYPDQPRATRAGWGYLLLTNVLPNQGNGPFKLYAFADDVDGNSTLLGTRTIVTANATATKPFGAIDTPGQGEIVSGSRYPNFGWVLSRGATRADPPGGGLVQVFIDGVLAGTPAGWTSRSDLTAAFPQAQYSGVGNALAVFEVDTTALSNGVHTIAWFVTDNQGVAEGVGSRFFTVSNGVSSSLRADTALPLLGAESAPRSEAPVDVRLGYDSAAPLQRVPLNDGVAVVHSEELDRIEVRIRAANLSSARPLPIGARLDPATGTFTWQPGVGFVGLYEFTFLDSANGLASMRYDIRIVIEPKGSLRPDIVIDTPQRQQDVSQPFALGGWATDRAALQGTGVTAIHVWAYPLAGGDPIFLGAAEYDGSRPDVAALKGQRFKNSGYGLTVVGLDPGGYDLAVFAWSPVKGRFLPAKTVRVTVR
jgi:uncharacterized repeat protein (TIGR03803 family)